MLLRDLQHLLGSVYAIDVDADVREYLITDVTALEHLEENEAARNTEERLLIDQRGEELGIALYLDAALLDRLSAMDPRQRLCGHNLADFCTALEGVSHFNYVAWNAALDKPVTLLELEMQAEIDKYVSARVLLGQQERSDLDGRLFERLFDSAAFDSALQPEELERYQDASRLAGCYCHSLESRFPPGRLSAGMVSELRAFFRLPQPAKVSRIRSAALS